jgi:hypothetical protein
MSAIYSLLELSSSALGQLQGIDYLVVQLGGLGEIPETKTPGFHLAYVAYDNISLKWYDEDLEKEVLSIRRLIDSFDLECDYHLCYRLENQRSGLFYCEIIIDDINRSSLGRYPWFRLESLRYFLITSGRGKILYLDTNNSPVHSLH